MNYIAIIKCFLFPQLLKKLWQEIEATANTNLKSGFARCLSRQAILSQRRFETLQTSQVHTTITSVLIEHLKSKRYGEKPQTIRRRLAEVEAGKSLTNDSSGEDTEEDTEEDNEEDKEEEPEGDSLIDGEMESSSDDEESRSEEEEEDSCLANASDDAESCAAENEIISDDFENVVSGKWIIALFSVGGAKSLHCKSHQAQ